MTTPICDFVRRYEALRPIRLHMPGHKQGTDITEIPGADVLYAAEGIIRESEENAAALFQSRRTLYSAEGSSLCIRAMLYLAQMHAALQGRRARIAAGRNAHRVFLEAAALLDPELEWIGESGSLLQCRVDPNALEDLFRSPSETGRICSRSPRSVTGTGHCCWRTTPTAPICAFCRGESTP